MDFGRWSKRGREDIIVDLATDGTKIGLIRLPAANPGSSMSLRELDQGVERLVSLYLSRIDPTGVLGLTWEGERPLEGVYRFRGLARRIFTGKEADDGAGGGQLDLDDSGDKQISVTFNQLLSGFAIKTLRPLTEVERYVNILLQERLVLMSGHSGFGLPQGLLSSALCLCLFGGNDGENGAYASRFVKSIACRQWRSKSEDSIAREVFSERHASFKAFLLEEASATQMRPILERLSEVVDRNVLILATNSSEDPVQVRVTQIRLPRDYDPHLLGLHLRKRLVTQEVANNAANNEMMSALGWLCGVFRAVSKHNAPSLMPVFLGCPLENTHKFRTWFIDTWNSDVVAELRRYGLKADSGGEDPVRFVIRSWPWKEDVAGLPQALASVIPRQRLRRTSTTRRTRPEGAEDPLVKKLATTPKPPPQQQPSPPPDPELLSRSSISLSLREDPLLMSSCLPSLGLILLLPLALCCNFIVSHFLTPTTTPTPPTTTTMTAAAESKKRQRYSAHYIRSGPAEHFTKKRFTFRFADETFPRIKHNPL